MSRRLFMALLVASGTAVLGSASLPARGAAEVRALVVVGASAIPMGSTRAALFKEQAIEQGLWEGVVRVARDLVESQAPVEVLAPGSLGVFWPGRPDGDFEGPLLTGLPQSPADSASPPERAGQLPSPLFGAVPGAPDPVLPEPNLEGVQPEQLSEEEAARLEAEREAERLAEEAETQRLRDALGRETVPYTKSFRIVEDQGERPALFTSDPDVATEYVLLMEVQVEVDRVRVRLEEMGLLTPLERSELTGIRLEIRGLTHYGGYQALVGLLQGEVVAAEAVVPRNFAPGRVVVTVEGDWAPEELLERLKQAAPENLQIEARAVDRPQDVDPVIEAGAPTLRLQVAWAPPAPPTPELEP